MSGFPRIGGSFGGYAIESLLGQGAMGVVFRAQQIALERPVALKVLSPVYAGVPEFRERFAREANLLASIDSPHIIQVYEHGEVEGCLFIATQLVPGGDLATLIEHRGRIAVEVALDIAAQLALGLAAAHEAGVVHRDVKPSNVLVHLHADRTHAYLCDFGIARGEDASVTRTGLLVGTYAYLAPERFNGADATPASDIYSVGCLLAGMITGSPPYGGSDLQVMQQHVGAPIPRIGLSGAGGERVEQLVQRAMAKDPAARHASADELAADLLTARQAVLAGSLVPPTTMRPLAMELSPTGVEPPRSGRNRRTGLWATVGVVAMLAVAGTALLLSRAGHDPRARTDVQATSKQTPEAKAAASPAQSSTRTCWNGASINGSAHCPAPAGLTGMRYVFPSFDQGYRAGRCASKPGDLAHTGKTMSWQCSVTLATGRQATVTYGGWVSWRAALDHYREKYRQPGARNGDLLVFGPSAVGNTPGASQASQLLAEQYPFSATAIAGSPEDAEAVMDQVDVRPIAEIAR